MSDFLAFWEGLGRVFLTTLPTETRMNTSSNCLGKGGKGFSPKWPCVRVRAHSGNEGVQALVSRVRTYLKNPSHPSQRVQTLYLCGSCWEGLLKKALPNPSQGECMSKPLREAMPNTAAFVDSMRKLLGAEVVNDLVRRGMQGEPVFYAEENGQSVGTEPRHGEAVPFDLDPRLPGGTHAKTATTTPRR